MESKSVKVVVIYGQGRIGKTTLATAVFSNLDFKNYKYSRFDMEQNCSDANLKLLQQQILEDLYDHKIQLRSLNEGREQLSKDFKEHSFKPVFIFVDNALKQSDLEKLLPINDLASLPAQSRILITTRNLNETRIILQEGIERCHYLVASLPQEEAWKLLCELALGSAQASFDPIVDINGLLQICQGIPLVLKMAGARLPEHAQSMPTCRDVVESLKSELLQGERDDLSEHMVDFVYNRLKASCKEAFLDIVFFFCNWKRQRVACSVGVTEFEELERAALVNIVKDMVHVHDIVKARGRMLSPDGERIIDLQSLTEVLKDVEFIDTIPSSLRYMYIKDATLVNLTTTLSQIQYLQSLTLRGCRGFSSLPETIDNLLVLEKLSLKFCDSLVSLPYNFGKISGLKKSPDSVGNLSSLHNLDLRSCSSLVSLPDSVGDLSSLSNLDLRSCSNLVSLPDSVGNLSYLSNLYLRSCSSLVTLPDSVGNLSFLNNLDLSSCSSLVSLPNSIGNLSSLNRLDLRSCSSLVGLPDSMGNLSSLNNLNLKSCSSLVSLPDSVGNLSSLNNLDLRSCYNLVSLPDTVGNLYRLVKLYLIRCTQLSLLPESFRNLASLERLVLQDCEKLSNLPQNFGQLKCLKYVSVHGCSVLQSFSSDFECLSSLIAVKASECSQLEENTMDKLAKMNGLMIVDIDGSPILKKRWEQVKEQYSLAVVECGRKEFETEMYPHEDVMYREFFHSESKLMHVDENGHLVESSRMTGGEKLWFLLKERDVRSAPSNSRCWETVKKKWMELVASEGAQMIYVDMGGSWEERERRVHYKYFLFD
ncbi:hypothetical protein SUGI_0964100 [Cryptomeria japonica]|nr:hypothetical protein SUGI_0964100 [Cryptomeria japonica]